MTNATDKRIAWLILDLLWEFCPGIVRDWIAKTIMSTIARGKK